MPTLNIYKEVEDWFCDTIDALFKDGIVCSKEFDVNKADSRACSATLKKGRDDQGVGFSGTATLKSMRKTRANAVADIDLVMSYFPVYNKNTDKGLVITVNLTYIMPPIKTIVGTKTAFLYTVNFKIN